MPCGCIVDKPTYPQNDEWGSILWFILHVMAEKAGKQNNMLQTQDEQRAWPLFQKALIDIIPCPYCREHYKEWALGNPFILPAYGEWNLYIRTWFWRLHSAVNLKLDKPIFPFEDLTSTYSNASALTYKFMQLDMLEIRAIQMGGVSLLKWNEWKKQFRMLRSSYGI
jgi:hypothetical protein